jgi:type I restriction enzyme S subunit
VIFATTRPYLKNIAIVPPELDGQICSTGFCVLRVDKAIIDPRFLFYVCRSDTIVEQLSQGNLRGASYPAVTDKDVFDSIISLPPLSEQRRIVAELEAVRAKLRALKSGQAETDSELRRLEGAILNQAFRGEL